MDRDYFPKPRLTRPPTEAPTMVEVLRAYVTDDDGVYDDAWSDLQDDIGDEMNERELA